MNIRTSSYFITLLELIILMLCLFPSLYPALVVIFFILCVIRLLVKIGNGSFLLELLYVYTAFTCLIMPMVGFFIFNRSNRIALAWLRYMVVNQEVYYSFVLPGIIFMGIGLFAFRKNTPDDSPVVDSLVREIEKQVVRIPPASILTLTFFSFVAYNISNFLPESVKQINTFLYYSLFASLFYIVFYKNFPKKIYVLSGITLFIVLDALRYSMFTVIAYMGGLFLIMLLAGKKISFSKKILLLVVSVVFIAFLQLFKVELRTSFKKKSHLTVTQLVGNVISNTNNLDYEQTLFPLYYRMNQGFNIALVMWRIPSRVDYIGGDKLFISFVSSFVPRLFWPDKPMAGGIENMRIYTGIKIEGFSTNVGPIGEAYGSFGFSAGWAYLLAFGFFIRLCYTQFIHYCKQIPLLFLWLPPIFYQTIYVIEADSLQAFNSLIKGFVFLFILYKLFPILFGVKPEEGGRRRMYVNRA